MEDLKNNPAFQQMNPQKQEMLELLIQSLQNKKLTEALPVVMNWNKQMEQKKLSFTPKENELLTAILSAQMSPAQKKQYELIKTMMKKQR